MVLLIHVEIVEWLRLWRSIAPPPPSLPSISHHPQNLLCTMLCDDGYDAAFVDGALIIFLAEETFTGRDSAFRLHVLETP